MNHSENIDLIAAAFTKALAELDDVKKSSTADTGSYRYSYADLPTVMASVRPTLAKHHLAIMQGTQEADRGIAVSTRVIHESGQWIDSGPLVMPTGKGGPQDIGSAISYARRYSPARLSRDRDRGRRRQTGTGIPRGSHRRTPAVGSGRRSNGRHERPHRHQERRIQGVGGRAQTVRCCSPRERAVARSGRGLARRVRGHGMSWDAWKPTRHHAETIGASLRHRRHQVGLTLSDLSLRVGVDVSMLSRIERGEAIPDPDAGQRLSSWLHQTHLQTPYSDETGPVGLSHPIVTPTPPRGTHPDTSRDAMVSVDRDNARAIHRWIISELGRADFGMTHEELWNTHRSDLRWARYAEDLPPKASQSGLRTRVSELVRGGVVKDSGERRPMSTGRKAIVWVLA